MPISIGVKYHSSGVSYDLLLRHGPLQNGLRLAGNVDCSMLLCFANPTQFDFSPNAASFLRAAGVDWGEAWMPREDYFGARRASPPTVGAIEKPARPLALTPQP